MDAQHNSNQVVGGEDVTALGETRCWAASFLKSQDGGAVGRRDLADFRERMRFLFKGWEESKQMGSMPPTGNYKALSSI